MAQSTPSRPNGVRAAVLEGPHHLAVRKLPRPSIDETTALLEVDLCGVCGTDLKYYSGALPAPYPIVLGHEIVGRLVEVGPIARRLLGADVGDRVIVESSIPCWTCRFCRSGAYRLCPNKGGYGTRCSIDDPPGLWGGLAELVFLAPGSIVHQVPPELSDRAAVCLPLLANGLTWLVRQGGLQPGERLLVCGCGPQGLAAVLAARAAGAAEVTITGLPTDVARLTYAAAAGARTVAVDPARSMADRLAAIGRDYDIVLEVTGSPESVALAAAHLRPQGRLILAGLVGRERVVAFRTDDLVYREIRIQGVLSKDGTAIEAAIALGTADPATAGLLAALVSHVYPLEAAGDAMRVVQQRPSTVLKVVVETGRAATPFAPPWSGAGAQR